MAKQASDYTAPEGYIFLADIKNRDHLSDKSLSNILKRHPFVRAWRMCASSLNLVNAYKIEGLYEYIDWWTKNMLTSPEQQKKIKARLEKVKQREFLKSNPPPVQTLSNMSDAFARVAKEMREERERFWG